MREITRIHGDVLRPFLQEKPRTRREMADHLKVSKGVIRHVLDSHPEIVVVARPLRGERREFYYGHKNTPKAEAPPEPIREAPGLTTFKTPWEVLKR